MSRQWFVAQAVRNREIAASVAVVAYGFEAYLPVIQRYRRIGHKLIEVSAPRFGVYIFVRFDRDNDPWPNILRIGHGHFERDLRSILCNADGVPSPVPDKAMDAIRAYQPASIKQEEPIIYKTGQRVTWLKAGIRREAVFVEYCGGTRPMVRTWIFGAERIAEVCEAELEPLELDTSHDLDATCAS